MNSHTGLDRADADATKGGALLTLADELTARGLDTWSPRWDGSEYLKLTNVAQALGEVTVSDSGLVVWEYRPLHGNSLHPNRMTRMVLAVLRADEAMIGRTVAVQFRDQPLTDNVRRSLGERGIRVTPKTFDAAPSEVYTEIEAVNPALPARGRALIADDGMLRWECSLDVRAEIQGIDLNHRQSASRRWY